MAVHGGEQASTRTTLVACAVVGALLSGLVGVVVAKVSDSLSSTGNSAESGGFAVRHDLQVARVDPTADCSTAPFADVDVAHISQVTVDLETMNVTPVDDRAICLKNKGPVAAGLRAHFFDVVDQEVGCSPGEPDPAFGNDGTCGTGLGELSALLRPALAAASGPGCHNTGDSFAGWQSGLRSLGGMGLGVVCKYVLQYGTQSAPEPDKARAQSDRVTFSIRFTLVD